MRRRAAQGKHRPRGAELGAAAAAAGARDPAGAGGDFRRAPSCSTTERHAGGEALPQALRELLAETSDVEIYALGLRHRAEAFYQRAVSITAEADLIPRLMDLTREIMTRPAAR